MFFRFIIKKGIVVFFLLLGITLLAFALICALPGDPASGLIGQRSDPGSIERINNALGVDKPFISKYLGYLKLLFQGEFGRSYYTNQPVGRDIINKFPTTMTLALFAIVWSSFVGTILGLIAGIKEGRIIDRVINFFCLTGLSVPVFWSGLLLILIFSFKLQLLPPSGSRGVEFFILPAITLGYPALSGITRVTRAAVIDIKGSPFVNVLYAKGITPLRIYSIHILKNVLIPLITVIGLDFGSFLNGAVLTETIFGLNGIGRYAMEGILKRDYPVVMGTILVGTLVFVLVNALVDVLYKYLDPRVRAYKSAL